ncbi:hypothetical protein D3C78_1153240 [compost metagenome]
MPVLEVLVHFFLRVVVHAQQGEAVLEQIAVEKAQIGHVELEVAAVVETQQEQGDYGALPGVALGDHEQALQCFNARLADLRELFFVGSQLSDFEHGVSPWYCIRREQ